MKTTVVTTLLVIVVACLFFYWWNQPCYVQPTVSEVCPPEIKKAMQKMGPYYNYKMIGETLYVNKGDGKWLKLNY